MTGTDGKPHTGLFEAWGQGDWYHRHHRRRRAARLTADADVYKKGLPLLTFAFLPPLLLFFAEFFAKAKFVGNMVVDRR